MRFVQIGLVIAAVSAVAWAVEPAKSGAPSTTAKKTAAKKTAAKNTAATTKPAAKKKYLTSSGAAKLGPTASATAAKPVAVVPKKTKRPVAPKLTPVKVRDRANAHETVFQNVSNAADIPVENAVALVPFFEQLYRHQKGEMPGPLRILHYGDSHTAADEWTGELRNRFQEKFGDGGSGYSFAGRPWNGYRREDVRSGSTRGWHTDGLVGRAGDGIYGLGGVSMSAKAPHEAVFVEAECSQAELYYYQQPGGGAVQVYENSTPVERISTDGEAGPAYYHLDCASGPQRLEAETLDNSPVRLFGWVAENPTGVTYETLGINGAQASIVFDWNEITLRSNIEHRNPGLIVLAYGTNEAGRKDLTLESYRDMFSQLIARFRAAAPAATILVIGPPDRAIKTRKGWQTMDKIDVIVEAQREAAEANGCPFWDLRAKMGGKGSMQQWIGAGLAQLDHVHFTAPGYKLLGDAVFRDVMSQYDVFLKARADILAHAPQGETPEQPRPASALAVAADVAAADAQTAR